jgi:glycosyltransferase involved in cell wall biosynthesis
LECPNRGASNCFLGDWGFYHKRKPLGSRKLLRLAYSFNPEKKANVTVAFLTANYFNNKISEGHKVLSDRIIDVVRGSTDWNVYIYSLEKPIEAERDLPYREITPSLREWFSSSIRIISFLNSTDIDLIHILAFNKVFPTLLDLITHYWQKSHKKIVHLYYHPNAFKDLKYKPIELLIRTKIFDMVLTTSYTLKDFLLKKLALSDEVIRVIPPIVPQKFFEFDYWSSRKLTLKLRRIYGLTESDFVILYIGHVIPQRGVFELLKAFKEASKLNPYLKLVISYPNIIFKDLSLDYLTIFRRMVEKYALKDKVLIIGKQDLSKLYTISDILFFGFRDSFYFTYPPLVVCEAMATGMPFILRRSSLVKELFNDNPPVPVYNTLDELENILCDLTNKTSSLINVSKILKGLAIERYHPRDISAKLINLYSELV